MWRERVRIQQHKSDRQQWQLQGFSILESGTLVSTQKGLMGSQSRRKGERDKRVVMPILSSARRASVQFSSVAQSCPTLQPHGLQHARPPSPSPAGGVYSNSCPSSWWCHPTISSSVIPFSSHLQSLPASGLKPDLICLNCDYLNQSNILVVENREKIRYDHCLRR